MKKKADWIFMITTIVGIYGGLNKILILIIPRFITFIRRKKRPIDHISIGKYRNIYLINLYFLNRTTKTNKNKIFSKNETLFNKIKFL